MTFHSIPSLPEMMELARRVEWDLSATERALEEHAWLKTLIVRPEDEAKVMAIEDEIPGLKIVVSPYIPPGQMYVVDDEQFDAMKEQWLEELKRTFPRPQQIDWNWASQLLMEERMGMRMAEKRINPRAFAVIAGVS